jgi:uncharacterized RDD family membrane protein YckC
MILAVGLPTVCLGFAAWIIQRRWLNLMFQTGNATVELASIPRRAFAKAFDLVLLGILGFYSITSHPEAIAWWISVISCFDSTQMSGLNRALSGATTNSFYSQMLEALSELLSVPINISILGAAIVLFVVQVFLQARWGITIGKWICKIRTVRTTLRPCGVARSLLRELLLVVDTVFFLSWVPGVIAILWTDASQRIGDHWADTIVVRSQRDNLLP